MNLIKYHPTD